MMTAVLAPLPQQRGEVAGVAGDECRVGSEAQNVVTVFVERRTDPDYQVSSNAGWEAGRSARAGRSTEIV